MKYLFCALAIVSACFAKNIMEPDIHIVGHRPHRGYHIYLYLDVDHDKLFAITRCEPISSKLSIQEILDTSLILDFKTAEKSFPTLLKRMENHYGLEVDQTPHKS